MNIPSFEEIFSLKSLFKSFKEFERGKKFKPDVAEFKSRLVENLMSLDSDIMFGNYKHVIFTSKCLTPSPEIFTRLPSEIEWCITPFIGHCIRILIPNLFLIRIPVGREREHIEL